MDQWMHFCVLATEPVSQQSVHSAQKATSKEHPLLEASPTSKFDRNKKNQNRTLVTPLNFSRILIGGGFVQ
jgi:hypothetical protein